MPSDHPGEDLPRFSFAFKVTETEMNWPGSFIPSEGGPLGGPPHFRPRHVSGYFGAWDAPIDPIT